MATKAVQSEQVIDVEETLEILDKLLDRVKALYEQYFLGIQKQPPTFIHHDLERKLRDLGTIQIRNTGLRYRYATLTQKYGSYNTYWRRTIRQIENGTYVRSLSKLSRKAAQAGEEIPEEILAKMPKRMRDQVRRDRDAAIALARRREQLAPGDAGEGDFYEEYTAPPQQVRDPRGAHVLGDEGDLDLEALFAAAEAGLDEATQTTRPPVPDVEDEFENLATPPPPPPAQPAQPAPLRAATLGFPMRTAPSPNSRMTPQPFPAIAPPPPPKVTPPSFPPVNRATGPQPIARQTQPGVEPARPSQPPGPLGRPSQPGIPPIPSPPPRDLSKTDADQLVVGARPLGRPAPTDSRTFAPSQGARPNPIAPGAMGGAKPVGVETMQGPFAREPSVAVPPRRSKRDTDLDAGETEPSMPAIPRGMPPAPSGQTPRPVMSPAQSTPAMRAVTGQTPRPVPTQPTPPRAVPPQATPSRPMAAQPTPPQSRPGMKAQMTPTPTPTRPQRPPPGMTDDDVKALYTKYVKAKEMVGETTNAQTYGKLLNTINAQAPKIMQEYNARGVDFSVVVKDNQVIIRAKPKP